MLVAVTAASGQLGRKVVKSLLEKMPASDIVAIVRDPERATDLGVALRVADYNDPAALRAAISGVDKVLLISGNPASGNRVGEHENVVNAAKAANVSHIVYTSILHVDEWHLTIAEDHRATEGLLMISDIPFTILRNGWYWENHTLGALAALQGGVLIDAIGNGRISWASRQDFAAAAASVLVDGKHLNRIYELAGDRSYTLTDVAAEFSRQSGRHMVYKDISEADLVQFFCKMGMDGKFATMLAEANAKGLRKNILQDDSLTLSTLIGRPTTSLGEAVGEALKPRLCHRLDDEVGL